MTLAELRDDILARHRSSDPFPHPFCTECEDARWPCDAVRLASMLTVERVAAGLHESRWSSYAERAAALLDAVKEDEQ